MDKIFKVEGDWVKHPNIKENAVRARDYQINVAEKALNQNTLVVMPTGLGKTIIACLVAAEVLHSKPKAKILVLAPTRPLVNQHKNSFEKMLSIQEVSVFTGALKQQERVDAWKKSKIIFSTPQTIRNDIEEKRYGLHDVGLLIVDEAHKAVGEYAYVPIAKNYVEQSSGLILGLTASPGGDKKKINEVLGNLYVKGVEARTRDDVDVKRYVKDIEVSWLTTELTREQKLIQRPLEELLYEKIEKLRKSGFIRYKKSIYVSKKDLIEVGSAIRKRMGSGRRGYLYGAFHNQAISVQAYHLLELLETQGVKPLRDYLERLFKKNELGKAEKSLLGDERIKRVYSLVISHEGGSHPKMDLLVDVLVKQFREKNNSLVIVFAQYRDTIESILALLEGASEVRPIRFVGQASRDGSRGLTQGEQQNILNDFKGRVYNTLVASSVGEEGIDVPDVDLVVFYEPLPSEIRSIQRRGRTGRSKVGKVVVLITKDTRDEAYLHAEVMREDKMHKIITRLKKK